MIRFGYSEIRTGWGLCGGGATRVSNFPVYYIYHPPILTTPRWLLSRSCLSEPPPSLIFRQTLIMMEELSEEAPELFCQEGLDANELIIVRPAESENKN